MIDANKENKHEQQSSLFYCRFIHIIILEDDPCRECRNQL